jgi:DNA adenine methylase
MIPYIGGKFYQANWIISNFPKNYKDMTYVEVFGGAGWVLFKKEPSKVEVYNDLNENLVNLFTTLRDNFEEFRRRAFWVLHSRSMFEEAKRKFLNNNFKDDIDRALSYAILLTQSFNTNMKSWRYAVRQRKINWNGFFNRLEKIRNRLINVYIENLDFENVIKKYDTENTLFYIDPPYLLENNKKNRYYFIEWDLKEHERLLKVVKKIKGKFIISYYEHPTILEWYSEFNIIKKNFAKLSQKKGKKDKGKEILILNYDPTQ